MIRRKNPPFGWAIPGGFVNAGEHLADAARREFKEETGLDVTLIEQRHTYSHPQRDPRQHVVSVVFIGHVPEDVVPVGADDAKEARIFKLDKLIDSDDFVDSNNKIAFDHSTILYDVSRWLDGFPKIAPCY